MQIKTNDVLFKKKGLTKKDKLNRNLFIGTVFIFPILLRILFKTTYHSFDIGTFEKWVAYTNPYWNVYQTDCYCNYPIIGIFLSTGVIKLTGSYQLYFMFLAFFESINTLLFYKLLRILKVHRSYLYSLLFMILPSTLFGGALWGQIDHIGLTFLFLLLISFSMLYRQSELKEATPIWLFAFIGVLFYLAIFTKQLLLFPILPIGIAFIIILLKYKNIQQFLTGFFIALIGFLILMIPFEWLLSYPRNGYFTHYQRILATGSDHMDIISGNGITIWQFFYTDLEHPSTDPLFLIFSPKIIGIFITLVISGCVFYLYIKKSYYRTDTSFQLGLLCLIIAIFNVTVNLFLTGTHERYLFYFYPFLILVFVGLRKNNVIFSRFDIVLFFIGAISYGIFVLAVLKEWMRIDGVYMNTIYHKLIPILHVIILVRLVLILKSIKESRSVISHLNK